MLSRYLATCRVVRPGLSPCRRFYARKVDHTLVNPENEEILRTLQEWRKEEGLSKGSKLALSKGAILVAAHPEPIRTIADVSNIPKLNAAVKVQICSVIQQKYGSSSTADGDTDFSTIGKRYDNDRKALNELMTVRGIGAAMARKLADNGCRSIAELVSTQRYLDMLSPAQKVAAEWHNHVKLPTPREDMEAIQEFMRDCLPAQWEIIPVGLYRRGHPRSRNVQFVLLHPAYRHVEVPHLPHRKEDGSLRMPHPKAPVNRVDSNILAAELIKPLERRRILAACHSTLNHRWQGVVRVPTKTEDGEWESLYARETGILQKTGTFKDVDFICASAKSKGAVMLAYTGDDAFFKCARERAEELGLYLNDHGLWRFHERMHPADPEAAKTKKTNDKCVQGYWEMLPSETEEQIFEKLEMDWLEPGQRDFQFYTRKNWV